MERILNYYISQNKITVTSIERDKILKNFFPVRIINTQNKVIDYCKHMNEAKFNIKKRNFVAIMFGFEPQNYQIIKNNFN